ncbi:MAG: outer membrane protein assembly factor BamA [Fibrobacteria bacterium]|nr:outer membrane protein assembly factor BamA [Fibrobacteria bacterium]
MRLRTVLFMAGHLLPLAVTAQELPQLLPEVEAPSPSLPEALSRTRIDSIRVEGTRTVDAAVVRGTLRMVVGDAFTDEGFADRSRESLRALMGLGLLADASIDYQASSEGGVVVVVHVVEHPSVSEISFKGNRKIKDKGLREKSTLSEGSVLSPAALERDRQAFLAAYQEKGYLDAEVTPDLGEPSATDSRVPLTWKVVEGSKIRVGRIYFEGNANLPRKKLLKPLRTKEKRWWRSGEFHDDSLRMDLESLRELYREKGFLDAQIKLDTIVRRPEKKRLDVHLTVEEGKRFYRGRVAFAGMDAVSERQLRSQLLIDSGEVMNQKKLEGEEKNLRDLYLEEGRIFVQVNPVRSFREDTLVDLLYTIKEGPPASIGQVIIEGNTKTRDKVVRREIRLFPGDLYRQSLLMRSFREIMQLNYFDAVLPEPQPKDDGSVDLLFRVTEKEKGTGTFSAGGAYSQRDGFVGTLGLQVPNVFGTGRRADFSLEYGEYKQSVSVGGNEPWFMDTPTRLGGSVFWTHQTSQYYDDYELTQYGFNLSLGRRLRWPDDYFSASTGYGFSFNSYGSSGDRSGLLQTDGIESSLSFTLTRDDKDLPVFPTTGSVYQISYRRIGGPIGGSFDYHEMRSKIQWWFPTVGKFVLGLEAQGGLVDGDVIQEKDLYSMGGTLGYEGKLRGYDPGSVGAYRLGRSYLSSTLELRYPVADQVLYLLAFADAGNVFGPTLRTVADVRADALGSPWDEIDLGSLKRDYGFGFRLNIPMMGILGFDFAWGLDPNENRYGQSIDNLGFHPNFIIESPF